MPSAKLEDKIEKEVEKASKRFGESFDREKFITTNPRTVEYQKKIDETNARLKAAMGSADMAAMKQLIVDLEIATLYPERKTGPMCVSSISCSQLKWVLLLKMQTRFI